MTPSCILKFVAFAGLMVAATFTAQAGEPGLRTTETSWQMTRLFAPGAAALAQEARGTVVIYEGIRDVDVERAMDEQFERLEHMMFVGTVVTGEGGEPLRDAKTGKVKTEDDDC